MEFNQLFVIRRRDEGYADHRYSRDLLIALLAGRDVIARNVEGAE